MAVADGQIQEETSAFLSLPEEKLLIAKRKHWFVLVAPLVIISVLGLFGVVFINLISSFFSLPLSFRIIALLLPITLIFSLLTRTIVDWYLHMYIITTRKILEVCYTPFFSHWVNQILLDQVRCTEVDINTNGLVNQIFNKGHVCLTFDRPTHEEEFTLTDIANPRQTGTYLTDIFDSQANGEKKQTIWYPLRQNSQRHINRTVAFR